MFMDTDDEIPDDDEFTGPQGPAGEPFEEEGDDDDDE